MFENTDGKSFKTNENILIDLDLQFKCLEAGTKKSEEGELNYDLTNFVEETKIIIKDIINLLK